MLREAIKSHYIGMNKEFRYRGEEPTRVETLSDAGFALAIGLLLISTSSPNTFEQLREFTSDLIPFGLCITLIVFVWFEHFKFFIRYGFRNSYVVALNTILLFIILFYVYPLKFLARLLTDMYGSFLSRLFGYDGSITSFSNVIAPHEVPELMVIYGIGAAGIFLTLTFMYRYALKKAQELELNELEIFDTKVSMYSNLIMGSIPVLSVMIAALIPNYVVASSTSGFIYFLYMPAMMIFGKKASAKRKILLEKEAATLPASAST